LNFWAFFQEEMRADGDILLKSELIDPSSGSLHQLVRRVSLMTIGSRRTVSQEDILVFKLLVEVREKCCTQGSLLGRMQEFLFVSLLVDCRNGLLILLGNWATLIGHRHVLLPLANSIASLLTGRMLMSRCVF
jgi:hypothetical protein